MAAPKPFKDYEFGFVHVDAKYLPQMPDEDARRYLFAAIDRAIRWVYVEILPSTAASAKSQPPAVSPAAGTLKKP